MQKLHLDHDHAFNGELNLKKLNFMFMFQVNCPGCFIYGFPLVNRLKTELGDSEINFFGMSTAFEDYEYNTAAHTKALVEDGALVGETKKMLASQSLNVYLEPIDFPIVMDATVSPEALKDNELVDKICLINPNFPVWSDHDKHLLRQKVRSYLSQQSQISFTFTMNQFRGTPTFVIFDDNMDILHQWFGHVDYQIVAQALKDTRAHL